MGSGVRDLSGWKKKREEKTQAEFHAICDGRVLPISQVPDITFAQKLLGDGVGFSYEEPVIYSPCDGEIILVAQTNHAIGLRAENGAEIMIHVGMDTVNLKGRGLHPLVRLHKNVKAGDPLLEIDRGVMRENGINLITPMILTNGEEYDLNIVKQDGEVTREEIAFVAVKRQAG